MTPDDLRTLVRSAVPDGPGVVALSGGADSAVLAWALCDRPGVRAVTIDHGLPASPLLAAAAQRIAVRLGLPWSLVSVLPAGPSEGALRDARLAALEAAAGPGEWIATGHTADDQAETVLGNLLRGAGPGGLSGIPRRRGRFVRPLLDVARADTRRLAGELGLPFVDDPSNADPAIRRNRIRHQTLPALAADFNPALGAALRRAADFAAADDAVLGERADAVPLRRDEEAILIPAAALRTLPEAVAARVVRRALRMIDGPHAGLSRSVAGVLSVARGDAVGGLPGGLRALREGPFVALAGPPPPPQDPVRWASGLPLRFGPWRFEPGGGAPVSAGDGAVIRAARPGDRLATPVGSRRVTDLLRESGVPPRLRSRWPVVDDRGRIAWVVGVRIAPPDGHAAVAVTATREAGITGPGRNA